MYNLLLNGLGYEPSRLLLFTYKWLDRTESKRSRFGARANMDLFCDGGRTPFVVEIAERFETNKNSGRPVEEEKEALQVVEWQ